MASNHEFTIPVGKLSLVGMKGCEDLAEKVNHYLVEWRAERHSDYFNESDFIGYCRDSYLLKASCPRFGDGEAKGTLKETVRGFREIIEGKHDEIPESCFLFAGTIDDVVAKYRKGE